MARAYASAPTRRASSISRSATGGPGRRVYIRFGVPEPREWREASRASGPRIAFFRLLSPRWLPVNCSCP